MNFLKLSLMNVKQNLKNYGMYIFSMIFSIMVFYNFLTLCFSEQFQNIASMDIIASIAGLCIFVLTLFFIFFISYSSQFFIEQRKKEFGIYAFMGIENNKIAGLFAFEGLLVGMIALVSGLLGGILVNKLFLMALAKLSHANTIMKFEINTPSLLITSIVFGVILLFASVKEYIILVRTDISKLLNAAKIYQVDQSKNKTMTGIIGLIIIILGYLLIIKYSDYNVPFPNAIIGTVLLIILGTVLLFKGFFSFYLSKKIKNKKFLYKNSNIVSYNNIVFRIRDNNKTLGAVAILITCCLTSVIVAASMRETFTNAYQDEAPYSISYISNGRTDDHVVSTAISNNEQEIAFQVEANLLTSNISLHEYISDVLIIKYSEVQNIISHITPKNKELIIKNKPAIGEGMVIVPTNMIGGFSLKDSISIAGKEIEVKDKFASSLFGRLMNTSVLVVNDQDFKYIEKNAQKAPRVHYKGVTLKEFDNTKEISSYLKKNSKMEYYTADMFDKHQYDFVNTIYFLGLFVALVFLLSVGSMMYFKCIADAMKDKEKFNVLRKIGTEEAYIKKVVYKQVGIFFLLPILVGILHSIVAGYAVTDLMNLEGSYASLVSIVCFSILYCMYYLITVRKYLHITK